MRRVFLALSLLVGQSVATTSGDDRSSDEARFRLARDRQFAGLDQKREGAWQGPFFFVQLADTQYGFFSRNQNVEDEARLAAKTVGHINRLKPRFVIVCGDLTNATPQAPQYEPQVRQFKDDFSQVSDDVPLVCVCGNHDIGNRPNAKSIASYRSHFGDDYFGFWVGGTRNLVLNSTVIKEPTAATDIYAAQDVWFRNQLKSADGSRATHTFVFQHHPWFLREPDEPDEYFNLPLERRTPALQAMQNAGVTAVFAGHYHRNAGGNAGDLEMITTGPVGLPMGKDPSGLRIVKVYADRIEHTYFGLDDVPDEVRLSPGDAKTAVE